MPDEADVECAIAMIWPAGRAEPLCEMFRVDRRRMRWESKHYSSGTSFHDGGGLYRGETARLLAERGTGSGLHRYPRSTPVTFVVANLAAEEFEARDPDEWTLEQLTQLPGADVTTIGP